MKLDVPSQAEAAAVGGRNNSSLSLKTLHSHTHQVNSAAFLPWMLFGLYIALSFNPIMFIWLFISLEMVDNQNPSQDLVSSPVQMCSGLLNKVP